MRAEVWYGHHIGNDLFFSQTLVVDKEKCLVLFDGSTETPSKLILMIRRRLGRLFARLDDSVEEVARLKFVIA
jgi:hypothetical protein